MKLERSSSAVLALRSLVQEVLSDTRLGLCPVFWTVLCLDSPEEYAA